MVEPFLAITGGVDIKNPILFIAIVVPHLLALGDIIKRSENVLEIGKSSHFKRYMTTHVKLTEI